MFSNPNFKNSSIAFIGRSSMHITYNDPRKCTATLVLSHDQNGDLNNLTFSHVDNTGNGEKILSLFITRECNDGLKLTVNSTSSECPIEMWINHPDGVSKIGSLIGELRFAALAAKPSKLETQKYVKDIIQPFSFITEIALNAPESKEVLAKKSFTGCSKFVLDNIAGVLEIQLQEFKSLLNWHIEHQLGTSETTKRLGQ